MEGKPSFWEIECEKICWKKKNIDIEIVISDVDKVRKVLRFNSKKKEAG